MKKGVVLIISISFFAVFMAFSVIFIGFSGDISWMIIPFMMPIAVFVFIALLVSKIAKKNQAFLQYKVCPNCGARVLLSAAYCHRCGEDLAAKTVICDYCGAKNKEGDIQCHNCNALL